jgi:O-antigen/teichoic acid export membrane protein
MSSSRTTKVIALSLGRGLTTLISLVSGMVMARVLSQAELATYRQTFLAYDIALPFLGLGVNQGIYYFLRRSDGPGGWWWTHW